MNFWRKIWAYLLAFLKVLATRIVPYTLGIGALVGLSFLVTQNFSVDALSERLVWTGLGIAVIAGFLVFGSTVGGRDYGLSGAFVRSAHVNDLINFNIEVRKQVESRFDLRMQAFIVGLLVFGCGALVQRWFG